MLKRRWTCERVDRIFTQIGDAEMRQRLAEILELLLVSSGQLQRPTAFARIESSLKTNPCLAIKQKGRL
jgi:hypothetical protein